ncbi:MAG: ABC transporter ATP-binding protein [Candidatus Nanopelagicales bacterium]
MSSIEIRGIRLAYGETHVLDDLDLTIGEGAVAAVLGPSGCGKTTLLRVIAGLVRPGSGSVRLGGRAVVDDGAFVRPEARGVGVVPQEGALFPHLDVAANVAFGLDRRDPARDRRVEELLALVGMAGTASLRPHQLSGGMQQRVAVARALARRPSVVLLDEPFSALDAGLRDDVRTDVLAAIRADGATAVLVTHDQDEALAAADRVAVMRAGRIVQEGTPYDVYREPVDLAVARFVGEAVEIPAVLKAPGVVETAYGVLAARTDGDQAPGAAGVLLARPEDLSLGDGGAGQVLGAARVVAVRFHGHDALVTASLPDGLRVTLRAQGRRDLRPGDEGVVSLLAGPRLLRVP